MGGGDQLEYQEPASLLLFCQELVDDLIARGLVRESTPGFVQQQAVFTLCDGYGNMVSSGPGRFGVGRTHDTAPEADSPWDLPAPRAKEPP